MLVGTDLEVAIRYRIEDVKVDENASPCVRSVTVSPERSRTKSADTTAPLAKARAGGGGGRKD